jgi:3-oxoacyl-[acyl-carrier protein] reductase
VSTIVLLGKTALVTGAGGGIGKATALLLAESGADVAVCDLNKEAVEATEKEILALGRKSHSYTVDVSNSAQVQEMIKEIIADFSKIDILINNAGITRDNLLMRMKDEDWDLVLSVNLKSVYLLSKAVSRHMIKARSGNIVNVASVIGVIGNTGQANYAASKAGVIGLTKSLAKEFASRNITVNAVAPGFIKTAMTDKLSEEVKSKMLEGIPLGFLGETTDVAKVIRFLVSEDARYITGQVIHIDGGMVM